MTTTTRTAALGVFAATLAAVLAFGITPRSVMAHTDHQVTISAGPAGVTYVDTFNPRLEPFICVSYSIQPADSAHELPGHGHRVWIVVHRILEGGGASAYNVY